MRSLNGPFPRDSLENGVGRRNVKQSYDSVTDSTGYTTVEFYFLFISQFAISDIAGIGRVCRMLVVFVGGYKWRTQREIIPVEYFLLVDLARRGEQASNEPMSTASATTTSTSIIGRGY
ncbi:hypothetical protein CBL_11829 [Carabus blaptoides fortunei]